MAAGEAGGSVRMKLRDRVRNILVQPRQEWPVIAEDFTDAWALLRDYAVPLSAIPAACAAVSGAYSTGFLHSAVNTVVAWALELLGLWIAAIVIEWLAPFFRSQGPRSQALKLVVYSSTPIWIAGVLNLVPPLRPLMVIPTLYAIYLFYLGLPTVMETPSGSVVSYMIVSGVAVVAVFLLPVILIGASWGVGYVLWRVAIGA